MEVTIKTIDELKAFILSNELSQKELRNLIRATLNVFIIEDYTNAEIITLISDYENQLALNGCAGLFLDKNPLDEIQVKDFVSSVFN